MFVEKQNKKTLSILMLAFFLVAFFGTAFTVKAASTGYFNYQLLEGIPGFFNRDQVMTDLPTLISAIYKFGIWTVGISAMFMLIIGGFTYMTSAGNKSAAGSAKGIITDALIGLVVALVAYLFLYVINPDLIKINLNIFSVKIEDVMMEGTPMGSSECKPLQNGDCSIVQLANFYQSKNGGSAEGDAALAWATNASGICNVESGGDASIKSRADRCQGADPKTGAMTDDPVSIGLFQINLTVHKMPGLDCPSAFGYTPPFKAYNSKVAENKKLCWVKDRPLYDKCVKAAQDAKTNTGIAWSIFKGNSSSWGPIGGWGANTTCRIAPMKTR